MTGISRRTLLAAATAAAALPAFTATAEAPVRARFLAAVADAGGSRAFAGFDGSGALVFRHELGARGHGMALHPRRPEAVIVARRPGTFMLAVDLATGAAVRRVTSPAGRHFYGHAAYSADGALLYTTENDYDNAAGAIGIYDATAGYERVGEWSGLEVGPHELALMPDGRTLVVAIGGIRTHPQSGRESLNLATMQPALVYLDAGDGRLLFRAALAPALHQLSIRHLDVGADGTVGLCMQHEGSGQDRVPIAAVQRGDGPIRLLDLPDDVSRRTLNYAGSVRLDGAGRVLAATCPRGNLALFWDLADDGRFLGRFVLFDVCGLAASGEAGGFILSSGAGGLAAVDGLAAGGPAGAPIAGADADRLSWDNHLVQTG